MSDTWNAIQEMKSKQSSLRAKILERKRLREDIEAEIANVDAGVKSASSHSPGSGSRPSSRSPSPAPPSGPNSSPSSSSAVPSSVTASPQKLPVSSLAKPSNPDIEKKLVQVFLDISLTIPCSAESLTRRTSKLLRQKVELPVIEDLLHKFAAQQLISVITKDSVDVKCEVIVTFVDIPKFAAVSHDVSASSSKTDADSAKRKRDSSPGIEVSVSKQSKQTIVHDDSIESLLSTQSAKERENKKLNDEILHLLSKPTAKEQSLVERFRSQRGQVQEFCPYGTKQECMKANGSREMCKKLHFRKIIEKHTDESLGDCSFLNTCFHMDQCKFVHYEIDYPEKTAETTLVKKDATMANDLCKDGPVIMYPPQWVQCDLRTFDMTVLGKFAVIMADPPWDIHMELPYGTMSDDEMRKLDVPHLQDDGYIFLWVTGRAMELARECLELWGYKRVDEIIWVKTNQLQRIIRTGRTGHWLNHGKEHCLIGMKGTPKGFNRGLDCDVIVAEVRATSHKPDEIYGIIERLAPGHRKIELFGRPHNVQKNWVTLGNQVDGVKLIDPDVVKAFKEQYPEGNCMKPPVKNR